MDRFGEHLFENQLRQMAGRDGFPVVWLTF
jgi:hypothetical protein